MILLDLAWDSRRRRRSTRSRRERQFGDAASGSMERSRGRVVDHGKRERALNMADNDTKAPGATPAGKTTRTKAKTAAKTRSEEHTSELQSLMRISYAVFCLKKKKDKQNQ